MDSFCCFRKFISGSSLTDVQWGRCVFGHLAFIIHRVYVNMLQCWSNSCRGRVVFVLLPCTRHLIPQIVVIGYQQAFENAVTVMYALGGSTNGVLHLLALARE